MKNSAYSRQFETAIKQEIEYVSSKSIKSSRDCIDLCNEIYFRTQEKINVNTVRRFFGLVKTEYPASQSTLKIFSKYCGFNSIDELYWLKQKENKPDHAEQERTLGHIVTLFLETMPDNRADKTFLSFVKNTIQFLNRDTEMAGLYLSQVIKTKNGQEYFFRHFVNTDKLNSYYGNGISNYLHEKQDKEGYVFGNSLLAYKYWLSNDDHALIDLSANLFLQQPFISSLPHDICGRYYAAKLFYNHAVAASAAAVLAEICDCRLIKNFTEDNNEKLFYFEYIITEALVLTGHYQDALHYIDLYRTNHTPAPDGNYIANINNLNLLESFALYKMNNNKMAEKIFNEIRPSGFNFLSRKLSNILYLTVGSALKRKNVKAAENRTELINETGFIRLHYIL